MFIAESAGDASASAPEPGAFDSVLVVVHGMGSAYTSQILLEWAEPLLERMDWIARDRLIGGTEQHGVTIHDSELTGPLPMVTATVAFPRRGTGDLVGDVVVGADTVRRRIAIIEARWSESFVPMTRREVFRWAVSFMWRAIGRMLTLFRQTMVLLPWLTLVERQRPPHRAPLLARLLMALVDLVRLAFTATAFAALWLGTVLLGIVLTPVLPLLSPLLLIPWFKNLAQGVLDAVVGSIGDVAAWKERPVRASAMRLVVRDALARAKELVGEDGEVHVFAHSQGAAVTCNTLFKEEDFHPAAFNVRRLTTVGAAVVLLGGENWRGRDERYLPVRNWLGDRDADDRPVEWANHWAVWDPFSAGPIADSRRGMRERWRAAYFPRRAGDELGPEEHTVHNTSQPFLDHSEYYRNVVQVVDPTARHLLGPDLAPRPAEIAYLENRLAVIDKKSLGTNALASIAIAAILPGLAAASALFASVVLGVASGIGAIVGLVPGGDPREASDSVGWLVDDGRLTGWGWALASALLAALLIWLNQVLNGVTERSLVWQRCPLRAGLWCWCSAVPRAAYVLGAAATVWFAILEWSRPTPTTATMAAWGAFLALLAGFVIAEPTIALVPQVAPARISAESVAPLAGAAPLTFRAAVRSGAYAREYNARVGLRRPPRSWWGRVVNGLFYRPIEGRRAEPAEPPAPADPPAAPVAAG